MTIFDSWTPESAYLLGLFYADGHLYANMKSAVLSTKDKQLAYLVNNLIESSKIALTHYSTKKGQRNFYRVHLNKDMAEKLHCFGLQRGNKTKTLQWPELLPPHFTRDFIRGFFDGDGSACDHPLQLSFHSRSIHFLDVLEHIGHALSCFSTTVKECPTCHRLSYYSITDVALWTMYLYLYPTTNICLLRKRDCLFRALGVNKIPDTSTLHMIYSRKEGEREMRIWTEAYRPFIMGGDVAGPVACDVPVSGPFDLGKEMRVIWPWPLMGRHL